MKHIVGKFFIAIITFGIGIAFNLFTTEIRCCLGIDSCQLPLCIQIKCLLGIYSAAQCPKPILPPPVPNQYAECKKRFDQAPCSGILTSDGKCYLGELRKKYNGQGFGLSSDAYQCYAGQFQSGKFHGDGLLLYKDRTIYQGKFYAGKRHGHGKMIDADGAVVYNGYWINDRHE